MPAAAVPAAAVPAAAMPSTAESTTVERAAAHSTSVEPTAVESATAAHAGVGRRGKHQRRNRCRCRRCQQSFPQSHFNLRKSGARPEAPCVRGENGKAAMNGSATGRSSALNFRKAPPPSWPGLPASQKLRRAKCASLASPKHMRRRDRATHPARVHAPKRLYRSQTLAGWVRIEAAHNGSWPRLDGLASVLYIYT
jgi:hypothetical protein